MKLREYPYLYLGSAREAKEYGELDQWETLRRPHSSIFR